MSREKTDKEYNNNLFNKNSTVLLRFFFHFVHFKQHRQKKNSLNNKKIKKFLFWLNTNTGMI
jgi:hypothetical protein